MESGGDVKLWALSGPIRTHFSILMQKVYFEFKKLIFFKNKTFYMLDYHIHDYDYPSVEAEAERYEASLGSAVWK